MSDFAEGSGDIADVADKLNELYLNMAMQQHAENKDKTFKVIDLPPKGKCYYCEAELSHDNENKRFCDDECQKDYIEELEHRQKLEKINGKR